MTKRWSPTPLRRAAIARIPVRSRVLTGGQHNPGTTTTPHGNCVLDSRRLSAVRPPLQCDRAGVAFLVAADRERRRPGRTEDEERWVSTDVVPACPDGIRSRPEFAAVRPFEGVNDLPPVQRVEHDAVQMDSRDGQDHHVWPQRLQQRMPQREAIDLERRSIGIAEPAPCRVGGDG